MEIGSEPGETDKMPVEEVLNVMKKITLDDKKSQKNVTCI